MTMEEFDEAFDKLLDYYPNTRMTEELMNIYFAGMAELSMQEFNYAFGRIVKEYEGDFIPKVSIILKYAKNSDSGNQVILAKRMLREAMRKFGKSGMINFEDKGIHAVIDFIGWRRLCAMTDEEFSNFLKWEFDGIYKDFMKNPYGTADYYTGSYRVIGQKIPIMVTYKSIGINTPNLKFIPLEYKNNTVQIENKVDLSEIKNKMLIGG